MDLLLYAAVYFLGLVLINGIVYASVFWPIMRFYNLGKKNLLLLAWPLIFLALNLFALIWIPIEQHQAYKHFKKGVVYKQRNTPIDYAYFYGKGCSEVCQELLLEGHIKGAIEIRPDGHKPHYKLIDDPACKIENSAQALPDGSSLWNYFKRCTERKFLSDSELNLVLKANVGKSITFFNGNSIFTDRDDIGTYQSFSRLDFATKISVAELNLYTRNSRDKEDILSKQGVLVSQRPVVPLIITSYPNAQRPLDSLWGRHKHHERSTSGKWDDREKRDEAVAWLSVERRKLIYLTLGIELDGKLSILGNK